MTREEAILLLHDMKDTYDEIHENTNYEIGYEQMTALDMAIEALSADAEWIPCSERLPLVSGEFLVTLVDHDGTWVSTAQWNMTFGGRWQDIFSNDGYRDISNVIAWKTLPTPYTKGESDDRQRFR